uniref:ATP-grasp domain-containing protein n=1 Tax=Trichobilharzia regenti TaxID=157069 RepID=A0AA85IRQ8_TRIRE|nr:unnamed protein product [Trichobilharzia regenti]
MRVLFRRRLAPLVTVSQSNNCGITRSCNATKINYENYDYWTLQQTDSTEPKCTPGIQPFDASNSLLSQTLTETDYSNDNELANMKCCTIETTEDCSQMDELKSCEVEDKSNSLDNESLETTSSATTTTTTTTTAETTDCSNPDQLQIPGNDESHHTDNHNNTVSKSNELSKTRVAQRKVSKSSSFSVTTNVVSQRKSIQQCKTERYRSVIESLTGVGKASQLSVERLKAARDEVEEAIKSRKIFSVLGPYNPIRQALRTRGWVEKFDTNNGSTGQNAQETSKSMRSINDNKTSRSYNSLQNDTTMEDSEDGDSDDDVTAANEEKQRVQPWEEDDGYYGIMSRMVRSEIPRFIWSLRKSQVEFRYLQKDQMINHHSGAPFTTKVGLCRQLRNIRWFADCDADRFFPRCFIISEEEDRQAFINDFKLTACISLVKMIASLTVDIYQPESGETVMCNVEDTVEATNVDGDGDDSHEDNNKIDVNSLKSENISMNDLYEDSVLSFQDNTISSNNSWDIDSPPNDSSKIIQTPNEIVNFAIFQCQEFLRFKHNDDLDKSKKFLAPEYPWDRFLSWYYHIVKTPQLLMNAKHLSPHCHQLCKLLKKCCPQFDMDGVRNVWIVKPGAKSRGRGIVCLDRLEDILKIVQGTVFLAEARYIVQKYIERPLLIYKTKFDIRQWILVTDWAPLTVWWYQDCYLRFCSQEFTLDNFSEAIHLCNNCIQHKYKNGPRSSELPDENMWTWEQFQTWLCKQGHPNIWKEKIQPSMKSAVLNALLSAQELIEPRKNCFGLYGADFLLTADDFRPWLIEINSSPCMSPSTSVTAVYTANVLEDTLKVVLDRKYSRNSDVGRFELLYRQHFHSSSSLYTGMELYVTGSRIVKPQQQQQLDSTTTSRCFCLNKTTPNLDQQTVLIPEINITATSVNDIGTSSPVVLGQIKSHIRKEVKSSNLQSDFTDTINIQKETNLLWPTATHKQHAIHKSTPTNLNVKASLKSLQITGGNSQSHVAKLKNGLKDNNKIKSTSNIEYLTETIEHKNDSINKSLIIGTESKCPQKPSSQDGIGVLNSLMTKSDEHYLTAGVKISHVSSQSSQSQINFRQKCEPIGLEKTSHTPLSSTNMQTNNEPSLLVLLPHKIHKKQNSLTCLKQNKAKSSIKTQRISPTNEIKTGNSNIETLNNITVSNSASFDNKLNKSSDDIRKSSHHLRHNEDSRKQSIGKVNGCNKLPAIVTMKSNSPSRCRKHQVTSDHKTMNKIHKIPGFVNRVNNNKVKMSIIHFNGKNVSIDYDHSSLCHNDMHRHSRRKTIIFRKLKNMKISSNLQKKISAKQSQTNLHDIQSACLNNQHNKPLNSNKLSKDQNMETDMSNNNFSDDFICHNHTNPSDDCVDDDDDGDDDDILSKSAQKQNSSDSGIDDGSTNESKSSHLSDKPLTTAKDNNNNNSKGIFHDDSLNTSTQYTQKAPFPSKSVTNMHPCKKLNLKFFTRNTVDQYQRK